MFICFHYIMFSKGCLGEFHVHLFLSLGLLLFIACMSIDTISANVKILAMVFKAAGVITEIAW